MKGMVLGAAVAVSGSLLAGGWPVLKTYEGEFLDRVKMPLGGIGTGTISLAGNGALVDWELQIAPNKGYVPKCWSWAPHFAVRTEDAAGRRVARVLEGPIPLILAKHRPRFKADPDYQLGAGCLIDQLLGDYAAQAILRNNRKPVGEKTFNPMRSFVLPDEATCAGAMTAAAIRLTRRSADITTSVRWRPGRCRRLLSIRDRFGSKVPGKT